MALMSIAIAASQDDCGEGPASFTPSQVLEALALVGLDQNPDMHGEAIEGTPLT